MAERQATIGNLELDGGISTLHSPLSDEATMDGAPPPLVGSAQVGSELWRTFGAIHTTRNNAQRRATTRNDA